MIIGNIGDPSEGFAAYPEAVLRALDYLRKTDFAKMKDGRYPVEGDDMYAILTRYKTKPSEECRPETHRKYIDLLYIISGEEYLGWCPMNPDLKVTEPYNAEKDIEFYEDLAPESHFVLSAGSIVVLFPKDVHKPFIMIGHEPTDVTKVIVKIAVSLLKHK